MPIVTKGTNPNTLGPTDRPMGQVSGNAPKPRPVVGYKSSNTGYSLQDLLGAVQVAPDDGFQAPGFAQNVNKTAIYGKAAPADTTPPHKTPTVPTKNSGNKSGKGGLQHGNVIGGGANKHDTDAQGFSGAGAVGNIDDFLNALGIGATITGAGGPFLGALGQITGYMDFLDPNGNIAVTNPDLWNAAVSYGQTKYPGNPQLALRAATNYVSAHDPTFGSSGTKAGFDSGGKSGFGDSGGGGFAGKEQDDNVGGGFSGKYASGGFVTNQDKRPLAEMTLDTMVMPYRVPAAKAPMVQKPHAGDGYSSGGYVQKKPQKLMHYHKIIEPIRHPSASKAMPAPDKAPERNILTADDMVAGYMGGGYVWNNTPKGNRGYMQGGFVPNRGYEHGGMITNGGGAMPSPADMQARQNPTPNQIASDGMPDNQPIMADEGEFVIQSEAAQILGPDVLNALNDPQIAAVVADTIRGLIGGGGGQDTSMGMGGGGGGMAPEGGMPMAGGGAPGPSGAMMNPEPDAMSYNGPSPLQTASKFLMR